MQIWLYGKSKIEHITPIFSDIFKWKAVVYYTTEIVVNCMILWSLFFNINSSFSDAVLLESFYIENAVLFAGDQKLRAILLLINSLLARIISLYQNEYY